MHPRLSPSSLYGRTTVRPCLTQRRAAWLGFRPGFAPPPPVRVWHLADLSAISALRAIVGKDPPAHRLLGPVHADLSGILPLGPDVLTTFVLKNARQLNHPNPLTRASARWGHMCALCRFKPDMLCVLRGLADCDCHPTDHERFLRYTWVMEIRVWGVPESRSVEITKHPLGAASTSIEAGDAHAALAAGYRDWSSTRLSHRAFAGRNLSPHGPGTCGGPGTCTLRESPCGTYRWRRSSYRTSLGTPTTQPVVVWWWRIR